MKELQLESEAMKRKTGYTFLLSVRVFYYWETLTFLHHISYYYKFYMLYLIKTKFDYINNILERNHSVLNLVNVTSLICFEQYLVWVEWTAQTCADPHRNEVMN